MPYVPENGGPEQAALKWRRLAKEHDLAVYDVTELLGNSAVFTDTMVNGPSMGGQEDAGAETAQQETAEARSAQPDTGLTVVGPLMSSVALRQVQSRPYTCLHVSTRRRFSGDDVSRILSGLTSVRRCALRHRVGLGKWSAQRRAWHGGSPS